MLIAVPTFLGGLVLLLGGAKWLVDGAARIGERAGIPPTIVGMVIVGFGTSLPELFVSLSAAFQGSAAIALTNVIGSNIGNIGLLLGIGAIVTPLTVSKGIVTREIPMLILASTAFAVLALDDLFDVGPNQLTRSDGLALLLFFAVFIYYTVLSAVRQVKSDRFAKEAESYAPATSTSSRSRDVLQTMLGLAGVGFGAHLMVSGAVDIAGTLGVSEAVIGLTVISLGTGLPELASTIVAARSGQHDLAVGGVVGSNIFNTLLVAGTAAVTKPELMPEGSTLDVIVMAGFALVLLPLAATDRRQLTRIEGFLLVGAYATYLIVVVVGRA